MPGRLPKPDETITRSPTVRPFSAKDRRLARSLPTVPLALLTARARTAQHGATQTGGWRNCARTVRRVLRQRRGGRHCTRQRICGETCEAREDAALRLALEVTLARDTAIIFACKQQRAVVDKPAFIASASCRSTYRSVHRARCLPSRRAQSVSRLCRLSGQGAIRPPTHVGRL